MRRYYRDPRRNPIFQMRPNGRNSGRRSGGVQSTMGRVMGLFSASLRGSTETSTNNNHVVPDFGLIGFSVQSYLDTDEGKIAAGWKCFGCGNAQPMSYFRENGYIACCPERELSPLCPEKVAQAVKDIREMERVTFRHIPQYPSPSREFSDLGA